MRTATLSFCEGSFEELEAHNTLEEARGYALGFRRGARKYEAGSVLCLVMPEDTDDLHEQHDSKIAFDTYVRWLRREELAMLPSRD